jgi:hypothetical protein
VRLFSLSILTDKIVLVVQSCRVPTPPSAGLLVSVKCDQPPLIVLICFGVRGRKATTKPTSFYSYITFIKPPLNCYAPPHYTIYSFPTAHF